MTKKKELAGVGPKQEMYENENGGVQSRVPYRCDLLPARALRFSYENYGQMPVHEEKTPATSILTKEFIHDSLSSLFFIQSTGNNEIFETQIFCAAGYAMQALECDLSESVFKIKFRLDFTAKITPLLTDMPANAILACSAVLKAGAESHGEENWRRILANDHINHAQMHLWAYLAGDTQDDHLSHAAIRLLFAAESKFTPMGPCHPAICVDGNPEMFNLIR